jgi:hypothetical protein
VSRIAALAAVCAFSLSAAPALAADYGPPAEVAAVRATEQASWDSNFKSAAPPKVDFVRVVGDYAVLGWIKGESGGMAAFHKTANGAWKKFVRDAGGALGAKDLEADGVPASIAKQLVPGSPG